MLSRVLAIACVAFAGTSRADDTADFLKADNWKGYEKDPISWKIDPEKKTITGETKENPKFNTFFCSQQSYGDFELVCKAKLTGPTANSGIQFRSVIVEKEKDKFVVAGPQADMGISGKILRWGNLYGEKIGGTMMDAPADKVTKYAKKDDWNNYYLLVKGDHVTIQLNGETMVDADFPTQPDKKPMPKTGIIAWQLHAGEPMKAEFTEIRFTNLKSSEGSPKP